MSNYKFNEELCRQLSNGEIAVHYNNGDLEMLRALLKKCAPEDDSKPEGSDVFYMVDRKGFWNSYLHVSKQVVPLSDFIVKESEGENPFVWTDELALEFANSTIRDIEQFKASKQRKPLFVTEDGVEVFEFGVELVCVEKDFNIRKAYISPFASPIKCNKYFSTEAAAREYVRLNKPMYSLNDIGDAWGKLCHEAFTYDQLITELEKLKP